MKKREISPIQGRFTGADRRRIRRALDVVREVRLYRRLDALLLMAEGHSLDDVARHVGCAAATVRRWAWRYLQSHDAQALADRPRSGRPRTATDLSPQQLASVLACDPRQFGYQATTWTVSLLASHLRTHQGISISARTLRRRLHEGRFRWKRPRYFYSERADHAGQKKGGSSAASRQA